MGNFNIYPTTILGKIRTRTPTQAQSLSSRYVFLNIKNAEPNLGRPPGIFGGSYTSTLTSDEYLGIRYALLSNNHSGSAWRVWAYDNPRIAAYSKEGSLGFGDTAYPLNIKSFVFSNYSYGNQNNRYNSQSFSERTFNVFSLSGIYLFNATTIGDPASAIEFIVTEEGKVGIGVEDPAEKLTVNGNISANGSLFVKDLSANNLTVSGNISASGNLAINGNTVLGDTTSDETIIRGTVKIADSDSDALVFGTNNGSYDTNLYRSAANTLKTDDSFIVDGNSFLNGNVTLGDSFSDNLIINSSSFVKSPLSSNSSGFFGSTLTVDSSVSASGGITVGRTTILPGTSAATLVNATTASSLTLTDIFLKINIGGKDYALPLYEYTT